MKVLLEHSNNVEKHIFFLESREKISKKIIKSLTLKSILSLEKTLYLRKIDLKPGKAKYV